MKTVVGIIICASLGLQAQSWEIHAFALRQSAKAEGNFPQTTYNLRGIAFVRDTERQPGDALLQYIFAFAPSPSEESSYQTVPQPPSQYRGASGNFSPGGFVSAGINLQTPGEFRVGIGLECRLGVQRTDSSSGDTGNGQANFKVRPWANFHVRYSPARAGLSPVFGFHVGLSTNSAPAPKSETSLFAGLRF